MLASIRSPPTSLNRPPVLPGEEPREEDISRRRFLGSDRGSLDEARIDGEPHVCCKHPDLGPEEPKVPGGDPVLVLPLRVTVAPEQAAPPDR